VPKKWAGNSRAKPKKKFGQKKTGENRGSQTPKKHMGQWRDRPGQFTRNNGESEKWLQGTARRTGGVVKSRDDWSLEKKPP